MQKITGIGGFFFRAGAQQTLSQWHENHFDINPIPQCYGDPAWHREAGHSVLAPFQEDTDYFGGQEKTWAINFRVGNLDAMLDQVRIAGIELWQPDPPE